MSGGGEPGGLHGAGRPEPAHSVRCALSLAPCASNAPLSLLLLARQNKVGPAGLGGASWPAMRPNFFKIFCEVLLNADFRNSNVLWFKIKYACAEVE